MTAAPTRWIAERGQLDDLLDEICGFPRYAIDTEFHRERTYFPRLALVQLAWPGGLALIDPLAVDPAPLARLFECGSLAVAHAAQQDLDVLAHAVGAVPKRLYDTQIAAGFVGYGTPSLVSLVQGELGVTPVKGDRLTDWLRRPLTEAQQEYAASDVAWLLDLHDRLDSRLQMLGRQAWVEASCEELRTRPTGGVHPDSAWVRLKDARSLRPRARAVAQAVAGWRERTAMATDTPVRQVLGDLAVLGIAQRQPTTLDELGQARGVDERHRRGKLAHDLIEAVEAGRNAEPPAAIGSNDDVERTMRPAITLISAWISQVARDERIDTALLATRSDLIAFLRGDSDARLSHGWRNELLGEAVSRLVQGHAGLTFDGHGSLRLIDVDGDAS